MLVPSRFVLAYGFISIALSLLKWLIPSFRSAFVSLDSFVSLVFFGYIVVWFGRQVWNYLPTSPPQ